MSEEDKKESGEVTRRQFLTGAGLVVGGAAVGAGIAWPLVPEKEIEVKVPTYVCVYDGLEFATVQQLEVHTEAEHPEAPGPTIEELTKLTVNGVTHELKLQPNWTLVDVLRDKLLLTGTKVGCDIGQCGQCTVLMDGRAIMSCMILAVTCEGKDILTIEGLADPVTGALHPLQAAFIAHHGMQCGFCTPGFIMSAKALLDKNPSPTLAEVKEGVSGVLCRCGAYPKIFESVLAAAK